MTGSPALQINAAAPLALAAGSTNHPAVVGNDMVYALDIPYHSAGVISLLGIRTTANATTGGTNTFALQINDTNVNQTFTIATGAPGVGFFEDVTHTDAVADGDTVQTELVVGTGGTLTVSMVRSIFTASSNTVCKLVCNDITSFNTASTFYYPIAGFIGSNPTVETYLKYRIKHASTVKNFVIRITNASTAVTFYVRKNGANSAVTIVANSLTGYLEDITHTFSTAADTDDINYSLVTSGTVSFTLYAMSVEYETTTGYANLSCGNSAGYSQQDNTTHYRGLSGNIFANTVESVVQAKAGAAFTFSNLRCMRSVSDTPPGVMRLRKNTANGNSVATIPGDSTGLYQDLVSSDVVAATDIIDISVVASSVSGTHYLVLTWIAVDSYAAAAGPNNVVRNMSTETVTVSEPAGSPARLSTKLRPIATQTISVSEPAPPSRVKGKVRGPLTQTVSISEPAGSPARLSAKIRGLPTETTTIPAGTLARLAAKIRALAAQTVTVSEPNPPAIVKARNVARALATETITIAAGTVARLKSVLRSQPIETTTIGAGTLGPRLKNSIRTMPTETVTISSGTITRIKGVIRALATETTTIGAGTLTRLSTKIRALQTQTISLSEAVDRFVTLAEANHVIKSMPTETVTVSEPNPPAIRRTKIRAITETVTKSESLARLATKVRSLPAETTTITAGTVTRIKGKVKAIPAETVTITAGTLTRLTAKIRTLPAETVTSGSESLARLTAKVRTFASAETISISDAVDRFKTSGGPKNIVRALDTETTNITESIARRTQKLRSFAVETVNVSEAALARLSQKRRNPPTESTTITAGTLVRIKGKVRALATQTVTVGTETIVRRLQKFRILNEIVSLLDAIEGYVNGIRIVPRGRPSHGGYGTVRTPVYKTRPKQILYPVYSPAEMERIERRRKLRQFQPLAVIPAFRNSINQTVAPFIITNPVTNTVNVKFAIKVKNDSNRVTFVGRSIPIIIIRSSQQQKININKAKCESFVMSEQGLHKSIQTTQKRMAKITKLMKLWFMAKELFG